MPHPMREFSFLSRLEGYSGRVQELSADEFDQDRIWSPSAEHPALRILLEHGTVLIAARDPALHVRCNLDSGTMWVSLDAHGPCEIDGIGAEGNAPVRIRVTAKVLECRERMTQEPPLVPLIAINPHGAVRDFIGVARLGQFAGHLVSKRGSRSQKPGQITEIDPYGGHGKLVGVDVTRLASAPYFEHAKKLSVFAPDVESLYDLACSYDRIASCLRRWRRGALFDPAEDRRSTPREQAHWFRDLYDAMGSNAVPASTRAAVRWCYALLEHESIKPRRAPVRGTRARRLRHIASREALESLGRWLHRCVGYGQRPSRALACWLIATAGVTFWADHRCPVAGGATGWLQRIIEVLLSPLGVLRLGYGGTTGPLGSPALDAVAYLAVGLPFLFFVVSLREFFRSPLRQRPAL
ncbi:MAG: hypothetical protein OXH67_14375 [Acidimicrobiaceae bacterium]|nr:hypothetical protein [Acidimicrobiaceae bacterium]